MTHADRPRFAMTVATTPADIDELGHVNNTVYVRMIQDVATAHWRAVAPAHIQARGVWVVARHEIDYRAPTGPGETLTLTTWVGSPRGARFDRYVEIAGADGGTRVSAKTLWALLDVATMRPMRIGADLAAPFMRVADRSETA